MAARSKSTKRGKKRGLTPKQAAFVKEYLVDLNATQAAIRAGYSEKTAQPHSARLVSKVIVSEAIAEGLKARSERVEITADQVLRELVKLGFSNMEDFASVNEKGMAALDLSNIDRDQFAAVTELTTDTIGELTTRTKIKLADKRANLELIGKHLGMFKPVGGADNPLTIAPQIPDLSGLSDEELELHRKLRKKIAHGRTE
ncbi:MAG: terminase small subunit [Nannocystaceae bacterium]